MRGLLLGLLVSMALVACSPQASAPTAIPTASPALNAKQLLASMQTKFATKPPPVGVDYWKVSVQECIAQSAIIFVCSANILEDTGGQAINKQASLTVTVDQATGDWIATGL